MSTLSERIVFPKNAAQVPARERDFAPERDRENPPALSVVLTVYNMGPCLIECLECIAAQTWTDYELICIDDGSTDGSGEVLDSYASAHPAVTVVHESNGGAGRARNAGMERARGEYLMLLDSDDLFESDLFERMVTQARAEHADVAVCRSCEYDHQTHETREAEWVVKKDLLPHARPFAPTDAPACPFAALMGWPWDKIYRTDHLRKNNLRFPAMANSEDLLFVYEALATAARITIVDDVLIKHRVNRTGSVSNSRLKSPYSFYEGICALKDTLKRDSASYAAYEWGFLNWAFDYACWNIQTLPEESPERAALAADFVEGRLTEIETDRHPLSYFSLYPDAAERFLDISSEVTGIPRTRTFWQFASAVCKNIDERGLGGAFKKAIGRAR